MNTIEDLRPEIIPLDADWSRTTLAGILAAPVATPARRTKHRGAAVAASVVGMMGIGGVAYATGLVPDFVTDAFDRLDATSPQPFDVSGITPISDFALPDGTQLTVWRGRNADGGSCEAVREERPGTEHDDFHASCFDGTDRSTYEALTFSQVQQPEAAGELQNPMYFVAYGEAPAAGARSVRITGDGASVTLPVDPATRGFGGHLTGLVPPPDGDLVHLTFSFLGADGQVVQVVQHRPGPPRGELGVIG